MSVTEFVDEFENRIVVFDFRTRADRAPKGLFRTTLGRRENAFFYRMNRRNMGRLREHVKRAN
jgi:hypothetical protein